jgi:hypothetical protein
MGINVTFLIAETKSMLLRGYGMRFISLSFDMATPDKTLVNPTKHVCLYKKGNGADFRGRAFLLIS